MKYLNTLAGGLCLASAGLAAMPASATQWSVSLWGTRRGFTEHVEKLAELVAEKTGGEFTMNISYGGLSAPAENLDGISVGAIDMAQFCAAYHPDKTPTLMVLDLPFLGVRSMEEERELDEAVFALPEVQKDLARWNARLLMSTPLPQYNLMGVGPAPRSAADLKGMRVRATGGMGEAFADAGAVPVSIASSDSYSALESGLLDSIAMAPHGLISFKVIELADWWTENLNPGTVTCPIAVSIDSYNALSDSEREALDSSVEEAMDHYFAAYDKVMDEWRPDLEANNVEVLTFPEEDLERFRNEVGSKVHDDWIEQYSAKGIDAQGIYDFVTGKIAEMHQ